MTKRAAAKREYVKPSADAILEAAEGVFARQGYGETSLRDLMAEAGVSTTAFYARFPSKEAVLVAIVERLLGALAEDAAVALAQAPSFDEGFDVGVDVLVKALRPRKVATKLALTEAVASPDAAAALRDAYGRLAELLKAGITGLAKKGGDEVDADSVAWALVGAMHVQLMRWAVFEDVSDAKLATTLRATARAMLPLVPRRRR